MKPYIVDDAASSNNNNKFSVTTQRVEELWAELSKAWPAIKNNPDTTEKIEKLWKILKASGNGHIEISKEVQNLISNNTVDSDFTQSPAINPGYTISNDIKTKAADTAIQADDEIDHLLADILGDDYKQKISHSSSQTNNKENETETTGDSSGTEELDKLVASILGEDWLKDESSTTNSISSDDKQAAKTIPNVKTSESSDLIFKTNHNIDSLVSSIIGNDSNEEVIKLTAAEVHAENQKLADNKEDIDQLLNAILNEDDVDESLTANNHSPSDNIYELNINKDTDSANTISSLNSITDEENIDDLINDILNKDTNTVDTTSSLSSMVNEKQTQTTESKTEEDIDDLINDIINKDTDTVDITSSLSSMVNEEQNQTTESKAEEDIDDLINDIINKDTDTVDTTSSLSNITDEEQTQTTESNEEEDIDDLINDIINKDTTSSLSNIIDEEQTQISESNPEENIDDLINEILEDKTNTNIIEENELNEEERVITDISENTSFQATDNRTTRKVTPPPILNTVETSTTYKQPEKERNNTLTMIILIILILACIGVWKLFFSNNESIAENTLIQEQYTDITSTIEEDSPVIEETYTPEKTYKTKPEYTPKTYQYETEVEPDSSVSSYYTPVETNENDITITLNTSETAIAENDSTIFNENITAIEIEPLIDDNIDTIEKIVETTSPTETLGANELVLKESKIEESKIEKTEKVKVEKSEKIIVRRKVIIHVIVKGDTLWAIAKRYVNNPYRYPELARLSKIKNPDRIYPGNKVNIIVYIK